MLQTLYVQNYVLIKELKIEFQKGLSIITGETGAGKSILLGAFSLLLGSRADSSVLLDKTKKCVVEASFAIGNYHLESFFSAHELDYSDEIIIRREVDSNRSRAFVNDTPVNLSLLKELGDRLIDIHSQHENLYLSDQVFRFDILDAIAGTHVLLQQYRQEYEQYRQLVAAKQDMEAKATRSKSDYEYYLFRFEELDKAHLKEGELPQLEEEVKTLSHAGEISNALLQAGELFTGETQSVIVQLKEIISLLNKIKENYPKAAELRERIENVYVEVKDIAAEVSLLASRVHVDPERLEQLTERLNLLYSLCQKYRVKTEEELIEEHQRLQKMLSEITSYDSQLEELNQKISLAYSRMHQLSADLTQRRSGIIGEFEKRVSEMLKVLGMPHAVFRVDLVEAREYGPYGKDAVSFLFSANKQIPPADIGKVASGGELSRLMLAIKSLVASSLTLPSIIFDEVDAGVSGEIAEKMGNIMRQMAASMQVISITHLPQVASKGHHHYRVYKTETGKTASTHIQLLTPEERVIEIARMLSGEKLTDAAIAHAKLLLTN